MHGALARYYLVLEYGYTRLAPGRFTRGILAAGRLATQIPKEGRVGVGVHLC